MNRSAIIDIINHPCEKQESEIIKDGFRIKESFKINTSEYISGIIKCSLSDNEYYAGDVEVYFDVNKVKKEHRAGFGYLEVNTKDQRQGIGTMLMLQVIEVIKTLKNFYMINNPITVSGWLSTTDKENGNWKKAIPLYASVGRMINTECYFIIKNDKNRYSAEEFLEKANTDGFVYFVV